MYELTKLSSGTTMQLRTDSIYTLSAVLESCICGDCLEEAKHTAGTEDELIYEMLSTSCGAEFLLEET